MTDAFALLHLPRRPWLDADEVRTAFQVRAAVAHPDRTGADGDFAAVAEAYEMLREPTMRLRHWLALCAPSTRLPAGLPADLIEWFPRVGTELKALKESAQARGAATSALAKAMAVTGAQRGETLLASIKAKRDRMFARVREIADPDEKAAGGADELAAIAAQLGFLDKWIAQLAEALLALKL